MIQWEYKTFEIDLKISIWKGNTFPDKAFLDTRLNEMGILGWELVHTVTNTIGEGQTNKMLFIFKRPKQ